MTGSLYAPDEFTKALNALAPNKPRLAAFYAGVMANLIGMLNDE